MKYLGMISSIFATAALMIGCGGNQVGVKPDNLPKWVLTTPGACGVGIAKIRNENIGMAKTTADSAMRNHQNST